ncbi:tyrosine-type recombinase/integrase [Novosphingobium sp. KCTC 2891]|uniref:tyrosine-type recombinase/integrase n=1 Tax=Novosphingobium sp. KCTC 2891 TaxID=2989730 RepID=UPI0022234B66|nr:DUF4102 domain-containing protein [Novosphingobium sp. KCTC 2891]
MPLTATAINAAKPKAKAYKLTDGMGLYLLVTPTGGRLWRMNYRFAGKQKTLSFGNFPDLSLAKARELRAAAREALALGRDPAEERKAREREATARLIETFGVISEEWLDRLQLEGRAEKTLAKLRWMVSMATPTLGQRPIAEITAPELLDVLRSIEVRGRYETATRLRSVDCR